MRTRATAVVTLMLLATATSGCRERRRNAVMEQLVRDAAAPAYRELGQRCQGLVEAVNHLTDAPDAAGLDAAKARWRDALAAWKETFPFRQGPLIPLAPHFHAVYWPSERRLVDAALAGSQPIDGAFVSQLGVSSKGMYVIERLLFGAPKDPEPPLAALTGPNGARRRAFLRALAADVASTAHAAVEIVTAPTFAAEFAKQGQAGLNRLANDLVAVTENVTSDRLQFMAGASQSGSLKWTPYEGQASATSQVTALSLLRGVERFYGRSTDEGLSRLVRASSSEAATAVQAAVTNAVGSVAALGGPLEEVALRDHAAVVRATEATRGIEMAFKTNVGSALGVTLTFSAGDGD